MPELLTTDGCLKHNSLKDKTISCRKKWKTQKTKKHWRLLNPHKVVTARSFLNKKIFGKHFSLFILDCRSRTCWSFLTSFILNDHVNQQVLTFVIPMFTRILSSFPHWKWCKFYFIHFQSFLHYCLQNKKLFFSSLCKNKLILSYLYFVTSPL